MVLKLRHFYEFGSFRLEPDERLLLAGDQPVPLAPKSFDLLVYLVQNHSRLLTKDQIMQTVWAGSFVEEANLTVAISAIRKALGEKESKLQYIETVSKRGYRFTASVREVEENPGASRPAADTTTTPPDQISRAGSADEFREAGVDFAPPIAVPEVASQGKHTRRMWVAAAIVIVVLAGVLASYSRHKKQTTNAQPPSAPRTLAILPFQNLKQDPDYDFLGFSLADAVITKLGYVSALTVRPSSSVEKFRNQVIEIPKVASELNVDTLLTGRFIRDGDNLRITYQLVDAKTDKILGEDSMDLKYDNLLRVQDNVAQRIIQDLELNLSASEAEQVKSDTPVSPLAYEYYLRGVDLYGRHEFPPAIKMLEKSAEIDPRYALTWAYLGASYTSHAAFELEGREQYRKAQAAYERALALQPAQLEAHIFLANLLVDTGKVEEAVPLLRDALKTNPNYAAAHWELGYAYRFTGMLEESVAECERARQIDPLVKANGSALNSYLYLGEYDKFLASLPESNDSLVLFYRGFGEFYQKNWELAAQHFDRAYALDPHLYTQIGMALNKSISHQDVDGLEILKFLENQISKRGVGDPEAYYKIAQAYAVLGDKPAALRVLGSSIESGFFCYPYIASDPLLNGIRNEPQFAELLSMARQRYEAFKAKFF